MSETATATGRLATEPALSVGAVTAAIAAVLALVSQLVPISAATQAALLGVLATVLPIISARLIRDRVYSPATVQSLVRIAVDTGLGYRNTAEKEQQS